MQISTKAPAVNNHSIPTQLSLVMDFTLSDGTSLIVRWHISFCRKFFAL